MYPTLYEIHSHRWRSLKSLSDHLFIYKQDIVQSTITRWHKTPDLLTTLVAILPQDVHQRCSTPKKCINVSLGYRSYKAMFLYSTCLEHSLFLIKVKINSWFRCFFFLGNIHFFVIYDFSIDPSRNICILWAKIYSY